jgi:hypothetical protein
LRITELNIVELDSSGNYRDRTSHNKTIMIKFASDLWQVRGFLCALGFPPPIKLTPLKFVESGVKHLFNGKGIKAKHMIFVGLFHSNADKNVIYNFS